MSFGPMESYWGEPSIATWDLDEHYVAAFRDKNSIRLDIARKDLAAGMNWDDLMDIKRQCGLGEYDGFELLPADKDVINTGPVRHIYIFANPLEWVRRQNGNH